MTDKVNEGTTLMLVERKSTIQEAISGMPNWRTMPDDEIVSAVTDQLGVKPASVKNKLAEMQKQHPRPEGTPPEQTISACMIVRDVEEHLDQCLASIAPLVSEIILCIDDRTVDKTAEIAAKYDTTISYYKWEDDFSKARNDCIALATGDWIFVIDGDQVLEPRAIPEIQQAAKAVNITHMVCQIWHHMPENGLSVHPSPRLFRSGTIGHGTEVGYFDTIHNQVQPVGDYVMIKSPIHHYGFNLSPEKMAAKHARTERLLLKQIANRPDYQFAYANLCRNYRQQARNDEVIDIGERGLALPDEHHQALPSMAIKVDMAWAHLMLNQPEAVLQACNDVLLGCPTNIDALMYAGHASGQKGDYEKAVWYYKKYLHHRHAQSETGQTIAIQLDTVGSVSAAHGNMAACYEKMGDHARAMQSSFRAAQNDKDNAAALKPLIGKLINAAKLTRLQNNRPRVLFVQRVPCIRAIKQAEALTKYGIEVGLAYQYGTANDHYGYGDHIFTELFPITAGGDLVAIGDSIKEAAEGWDLLHFHNEPDILTVAAMGALMNVIPIIHDEHDILSERIPGSLPHLWMERLAIYGADGIVVVSPVQFEHLRARYGLRDSIVALVRSVVPTALIPKKRKKKLSAKDGQIHLVYEGGLRVGGGHRDCLQFFSDLAGGKVHVHIYPNGDAPEYRELADSNHCIHYYDPLPPDKLMVQLTQYNAGLIPLMVADNPALRHAKNCSLPNKIFEYLACGLPVAARDLQQLTMFIEENKCGVLFESADDLLEQVDDLVSIPIGDNLTFTMEDEIKKLIALYMRLLKPQPVAQVVKKPEKEVAPKAAEVDGND